MHSRIGLSAVALAAMLCLPAFSTFSTPAHAQDKKFPDGWEGQWARHSRIGLWDASKPAGLGQQAPLTPEYQAILEANVKKAAEGKDYDPKTNCAPPGMPRVMMIYQPMEIIIKPTVTYFLIESTSPVRRVYTDGRDWPKQMLPAFAGYSIGQWHDEDGDGTYDLLTIETRGISGRRLVDNAGIELHADDSTVVKERISIDKKNPDIMNNEITTIDDAFTRPWTVTRQYKRDKDGTPAEYNCEEKRNVVINGEIYWIGVDGYLMPIMKNQKAPDLRHFQQTAR